MQSMCCLYPYFISGNQIKKSNITSATLVLSSSPARSAVSIISKHDTGCPVILAFMLLQTSGTGMKSWCQYSVLVTLLHIYHPAARLSSIFEHSQNPAGDLYVHLVLAKHLSSTAFLYGWVLTDKLTEQIHPCLVKGTRKDLRAPRSMH